MKTNLVLAAISLLAFSGCTVNRKLSLSTIDVDPGYSSISPLLLVVQDKRDQVIVNGKKQSWSGRVNIYNIKTDTRKPVSYELAKIVSYAIAKNGAKIAKIVLAPHEDFQSVLEEFPLRPEKRLLYLVIKNWETNCHSLFPTMRYEVISTFELRVYDQSAKMIADEEVGDSKIKEQGAAVNMLVLQNLTEVALQEQIKKLFNKPSIKSSLQGVPLVNSYQ